MSKGQEAFERFLEHCASEHDSYCINGDDLKDIAIIEKELMAFDIIKEKNVDIVALSLAKTVEDYNVYTYTSISASKELTEEEFETLKRWSDRKESE